MRFGIYSYLSKAWEYTNLTPCVSDQRLKLYGGYKLNKGVVWAFGPLIDGTTGPM
jgi:hypothetical protein